MTYRLIITIFFILFNLSGFCQTISGKVVGIMDGDTFKMLTKDSTLVRVRLANIDCPENKQPYSKKAKEFTANALFGKEVTISSQKTDRYKRYISDVVYNDSLSLTHQLLKAGLAWHFIRYSNDSTLQKVEDLARINHLGLWKDTNPIAPWEWRKNKKRKNN
ncbi:Endonuclease YncB, thermonuclease family [Flavobacteriaceae bacterium MAR_2010_188]|nr:Endonuclease YncB, thermonuclease family [Flavobacteriaceae bacterium MAR_2010_188]